jgi:hypothetical protein
MTTDSPDPVERVLVTATIVHVSGHMETVDLTLQGRDFNISESREVTPRYNPDGSVAEFTHGPTTFALSGVVREDAGSRVEA